MLVRTEENLQVEKALNDRTEDLKLGKVGAKSMAKDIVQEQVRAPAPMLADTLSRDVSGSKQSLRYM